MIVLKYINYMMFILSILPLFFAQEIYTSEIYILFSIYFLIIFIYDLKRKNYANRKMLIIIDLISILSLLGPFKYLILLRLVRVNRFLLKYKGFRLIGKIIVNNKDMFIVTITTALLYCLLTSLIMFQIEPETFNNSYFDAFYWSVISLTTVGYGDIYPLTNLGKIIAMISSFIGIAIIALPTGVIASEFLKLTSNSNEDEVVEIED